jgi:metal-responsive CopG/Arc/MetJ family transcriptional regulator
MKTESIMVELPADLALKLKSYVADGWAASTDEVIAEATRRYLWTHRPEVIERHLREDVQMALHEGK